MVMAEGDSLLKEIILEATLTVEKRPHVKVVLSFERLSWDMGSILTKDIIGADSVVNSNEFVIYSYPKKANDKETKRSYKPLRMSANDKKTAELWIKRIIQCIYNAPYDEQDPRKNMKCILILINPAGGSGKAKKTYYNECHQMILQSGLPHEIVETTHQYHALEYVKKCDITKYSSIVAMSGDGLLSEIVNGLMTRVDWEDAVKQVNVGHLPGGSGNGLCKSMLWMSNEAYSPINATYLIIKGGYRPLDIYTIRQGKNKLKYGFLGFEWALISDIDFQSEDCRYCGGQRFFFYAIRRLLCLRQYKGSYKYLAAPEVPTKLINSDKHIERPDVQSCGNSHDCMVCQLSDDEREYNKLRKYMSDPSQSVEVKEHWVEGESDDITLLWAANLQFGASDVMPGTLSHCSDGYLDLNVAHDEGTCRMIKLMDGTETGKHINCDFLVYLKTKGIRVNPMKNINKRESLFGYDGEQLPMEEVEVRCFRGILNVLCL